VAWFTLNANVNSQNKRYWCSKNPHVIHLQGLKTVWHAVSACKNTEPMCLEETKILAGMFG
jgi:hypothetical protein